jgi:hypothetical protein
MSDYIKKLAKQAGMEWDTHIWCWLANPPHLERFAKLVRQDEREANAKLCSEMQKKLGEYKDYEDTHDDGWLDALCELETAIRARGNHEQD